jgi:hypothetical protein
MMAPQFDDTITRRDLKKLLDKEESNQISTELAVVKTTLEHISETLDKLDEKIELLFTKHDRNREDIVELKSEKKTIFAVGTSVLAIVWAVISTWLQKKI